MERDKSEVARIRRQIEEECHALKLMFNAPASVGSHAIVTNRFKMIDKKTDQLGQFIGAESANELVCDIYTRIIG